MLRHVTLIQGKMSTTYTKCIHLYTDAKIKKVKNSKYGEK